MKCPVCRGPLPDPKPTGRPRRVCGDKCRKNASKRRRRRSVHFSSASVEWYTPPEVFSEYAERFGPFTLDPATCPESPIWPLVPSHYTAADDGLVQPWSGRVWLNPPYGAAIAAWLERAARAVRDGEAELVVCLVPARTDTGWWHDARAAGAAAELRRGRIRFLRPGIAEDGTPILVRGSGAAFPSAVLVFRRPSVATKPPGAPPPALRFPKR